MGDCYLSLRLGFDFSSSRLVDFLDSPTRWRSLCSTVRMRFSMLFFLVFRRSILRALSERTGFLRTSVLSSMWTKLKIRMECNRKCGLTCVFLATVWSGKLETAHAVDLHFTIFCHVIRSTFLFGSKHIHLTGTITTGRLVALRTCWFGHIFISPWFTCGSL